MAEVVDVPDVGETQVVRLACHPFPHFKRGPIRKRRAQHPVGIDSPPNGGKDAAGKHFRLARSGRGKHEMASRRERHDLRLLFRKLHGESGLQNRLLSLRRELFV